MQEQDVKISRISGIRFDTKDQAKRQYNFEAVVRTCLQLNPFLQMAMAEPFCFDDSLRNIQEDLIWRNFLASGEVLICLDLQGAPAGFQALNNVVPGRTANWFGFVHPHYRGHRLSLEWARKALDYAFDDFGPRGLGLMKVKAQVSVHNEAAIALCRALGGAVVGVSPFDGLFHGKPADMMLFEFYSMPLVGQAEVLESDGRYEQSTAGGSELHSTPKLHFTGAVPISEHAGSPADVQRGGLEFDGGGHDRAERAESARPITDNGISVERRISVTQLSPDVEQSDQPGSAAPVRPNILQSVPKPADAADHGEQLQQRDGQLDIRRGRTRPGRSARGNADDPSGSTVHDAKFE